MSKSACANRPQLRNVVVRVVCLSALVAQDSSDGKATGFAFPATPCAHNRIYPCFDLFLALNPIAAKVGRGFIPSTLDAAKCQIVPVSGCVELQSECTGCALQGSTVDDSRACPGITSGGFDKDAGIWLPEPLGADAHSRRADVLCRGPFREHGLSPTREQHFELPGTPLFSPALSSRHALRRSWARARNSAYRRRQR
jgi:hypothetical protein